METKGAYNKYAQLPACGAALALPLFGKAVQAVEFDAEGHPIGIADYGSSQGKNSIAPMQFAIRPTTPDRPKSRNLHVPH